MAVTGSSSLQHKNVAVFFILIMAVVATAHDGASHSKYHDCFEKCQDSCITKWGYAFCEMKCEGDCGVQEVASNCRDDGNK
nr:major pollen allergen Ole E 6-like [Ipomoea batatas]